MSNVEDPIIREEIPIVFRSGDVERPGFLIKEENRFFFEDENRNHVSVHLFRLR